MSAHRRAPLQPKLGPCQAPGHRPPSPPRIPNLVRSWAATRCPRGLDHRRQATRRLPHLRMGRCRCCITPAAANAARRARTLLPPPARAPSAPAAAER